MYKLASGSLKSIYRTAASNTGSETKSFKLEALIALRIKASIERISDTFHLNVLPLENKRTKKSIENISNILRKRTRAAGPCDSHTTRNAAPLLNIQSLTRYRSKQKRNQSTLYWFITTRTRTNNSGNQTRNYRTNNIQNKTKNNQTSNKRSKSLVMNKTNNRNT